MPDELVEIITGKERRRRWSTEEKLRIVAEAEEPRASVTEVAARHEVYPSLLFNWRRQVREGRLCAHGSSSIVPVRLLASLQETKAPPARRASDKSGAAGIEISARSASPASARVWAVQCARQVGPAEAQSAETRHHQSIDLDQCLNAADRR